MSISKPNLPEIVRFSTLDLVLRSRPITVFTFKRNMKTNEDHFVNFGTMYNMEIIILFLEVTRKKDRFKNKEYAVKI